MLLIIDIGAGVEGSTSDTEGWGGGLKSFPCDSLAVTIFFNAASIQ